MARLISAFIAVLIGALLGTSAVRAARACPLSVTGEPARGVGSYAFDSVRAGLFVSTAAEAARWSSGATLPTHGQRIELDDGSFLVFR